MYLSDVLPFLCQLGIGIYVVASMFFVLGALFARFTKGKDEFWAWLPRRNDNSPDVSLLKTLVVVAICVPMLLTLLCIKIYDDPGIFMRLYREQKEQRELRRRQALNARAQQVIIDELTKSFFQYLQTRSEEIKQIGEPCIGYKRLLLVVFDGSEEEGDKAHCQECAVCHQLATLISEAEQDFLLQLQQKSR